MKKYGAFPEFCCPIHREPLVVNTDALHCSRGESYSIENGIPRFVPSSNYADAFGVQWNRYRRTQLDSYSGTTISKDRAKRSIGEPLWSELTGMHVLECGCGAGRFTEVLLGQGASVTSIDLSSAVEANDANFPQDSTHRVAQASILNLPFEGQEFDLVFCLGVVQHTPRPEETVAALYAQVRPGGTLVFDHFRPSLSRYTKSANLVRRVLRKLPPERGIRATEALARHLLPLHRMTRHFPPGQILLSRLSPVESYYHVYPELGDELLAEWAVLDTHDSLTAYYSHIRTPRQIRRLLEDLGLCDISLFGVYANTEARGRRPESQGDLMSRHAVREAGA